MACTSSDRYLQYAMEVMRKLKEQNICVEVDERDEKLGDEIRKARLDKVPYRVTVGERGQKK